MAIPARKPVYDRVEEIRAQIDTAFENWRLEDISAGQERPTVEDLIVEIEMALHPIHIKEVDA